MKITVSSSFNGRDLAIIKAIINLKSNYGDVCYEYVEDCKSCQLLITKDYLDKGAKFYGLNQVSGARLTIKPELNPNSLRQMFRRIAKSPDKFCVTKLEVKPPESIEELILQEVSHPSLTHFEFKSPDIDLIFNMTDGVVMSQTKITQHTISDIRNVPLSHVEIKKHNFENSDGFCHSYCLAEFLWQLGYQQNQQLIQPRIDKHTSSFKQISWPNYGKLDFHNDFILLSAKLWKCSHSYEELCIESGVDEKVINQFLNANLMAGNVSVIVSEIKPKVKKLNGASKFITGLKQFFTKKERVSNYSGV